MERDLNADLHPYATLAYANTLSHVGNPLYVPAWQTHIIARSWQGRAEDAMGPYPLTCMAPTSDVRLGLQNLREEGLVSIAIVVDGLLGPAPSQLQEAFSFARPFKMHCVFDPTVAEYMPCKHHRYEIRRAAQHGVEVKVVELRDILHTWDALYAELISRRHITGIQKFPRESFVALAGCEGICTVAAFIGQELVSCHVWFGHSGFVWSHLAATSARGYATGAAYAVYDFSIRSFPGKVINLGGAAGLDEAPDDGLARFKAGFANRRQIAYLFGAVLDPDAYKSLSEERGPSTGDYFPAYRAPISRDACTPRLDAP